MSDLKDLLGGRSMSSLRLGLPLLGLSLFVLPSSSFLPYTAPLAATTPSFVGKPLAPQGVNTVVGPWSSSSRASLVSLNSKKGGGKGKKEPPPKTIVKHLDEDEVEFIIMNDGKAKTMINTTAETLVTRGSAQYVVGLPVDTPIVVVDGEMVPLDIDEDEAQLKAMMASVEKALTGAGAKLINTAGTLTIEGAFEFYDDFDDEGDFGGDVEELGETDEEGSSGDDSTLPFKNVVDPDFVDRVGSNSPGSEDFEFDDRDDSFLDDEEAYLEEMTEELVKLDYESQTYTIRKFVQPFYLCAKRTADAWEILKGEDADQVLDWVLQDDLENEFLLLEEDNR